MENMRFWKNIADLIFVLKKNNEALEKYFRFDFCLIETMRFWKNVSDLIFV